jgi:hypothetical protein
MLCVGAGDERLDVAVVTSPRADRLARDRLIDRLDAADGPGAARPGWLG